MQLSGEQLGSHVDSERLAELLAADEELRNALPDPAATAAIKDPSTTLDRQIETALTVYADRPALAERATEPVVDPATGRTTLRLLPRFDTITYREVRDR